MARKNMDIWDAFCSSTFAQDAQFCPGSRKVALWVFYYSYPLLKTCGNYIMSSLVSSFLFVLQASSSAVWSLIWAQMPALFSSFCFLMEMTATQNLLLPSAGLCIADRGLPEGRRISRQNRSALANVYLTLCGRGTLHLTSHEAKTATLPFRL